jgi:hypothetical protein
VHPMWCSLAHLVDLWEINLTPCWISSHLLWLCHLCCCSSNKVLSR